VHKNLKRIGAVAGVVAFAASLSACRLTGFNDTPSKSTASSATAWLLTQQETDGGFEVANFSGFETPDAILAIAENAQQQYAWDKTQARNAVLARVKNGHTPLHAIDDLVDGSGLDAGLAAKIIVLVVEPLGLSPTAFDPDGDGGHTNLVNVLNSGAQPDGSYGAGALNATTYAAIAKRLVDGAVPANTVTFIRNAQQASGGWDYSGVPTTTTLDIDTTAVAIEALAAAGVPLTDPDLRAGLVFLANQRRASGAWQAFASDDPNSTSTAVDAINSAGFDPNQPCWRNTVVPAQSGQPYVSPLAWLRSQQNADGHINSPNDDFGVNTFATSQSIQALRRGWIPVAPLFPQSCP
jgi:hypothetical protein